VIPNEKIMYTSFAMPVKGLPVLLQPLRNWIACMQFVGQVLNKFVFFKVHFISGQYWDLGLKSNAIQLPRRETLLAFGTSFSKPNVLIVWSLGANWYVRVSYSWTFHVLCLHFIVEDNYFMSFEILEVGILHSKFLLLSPASTWINKWGK
jgi:hypothetical protein